MEKLSDTLDYHRKRARRIKSPPSHEQMLGLRACNIIGILSLSVIASIDLWARRIDPMGGYGSLFEDLAFFFLGPAITFAMLLVWLFTLWKFLERWTQRTKSALWVIAAFLIVAITNIVIAFDMPFYLAFAHSRPALEQAVAQSLADPQKNFSHHELGVLPIESISLHGPNATVSVTGAGFDIDHSLQWIPDGLPPSGARRIKSLGHDWYWVDGNQ